jgi:hypothetical protein
MERKRHSTTPTLALLIALIDGLLIFLTLRKELPILQVEFQTPFPKVLNETTMWYNLAEVMFHSGGLIIIYGMISLLIPRLRFILASGVFITNLAGVPFLFAVLTSWRSHQPEIAVQQALLMFLLCMILPFLASKLFGLIKGPGENHH